MFKLGQPLLLHLPLTFSDVQRSEIWTKSKKSFWIVEEAALCVLGALRECSGHFLPSLVVRQQCCHRQKSQKCRPLRPQWELPTHSKVNHFLKRHARY